MHIPNSMLHGAVCPVTAALSAVAVGGAAYAAWRCREKPTPAAFACVSSMIFGVQLLNFPVSHGTSAHIIGGLLAVSLLGTPFAILSMTVVLGVQALFFGDGGLNTLGANIINMAVICAGGGGLMLSVLRRLNVPQKAALALASWGSVVAASVVCSGELASSGGGFWQILSSMAGVHSAVGVAEGAGTLILLSVLRKAGARKYALASMSLALLAALISPWASSLPELLQRAAGQVPAANLGLVPALLAALGGLAVVFVLSLALENMIHPVRGGRYARS